jgi:hypothetical protein
MKYFFQKNFVIIKEFLMEKMEYVIVLLDYLVIIVIF